MSRARRGLTCVALCATAVTAPSATAAAAQPACAHARAVPAQASRTAAGQALQCLVNRLRREHGLRPLRGERHLHRAAQRHAADMAAHDFFDHVSPGGATLQRRVRRTGYLRRARRWRLGEALAWGRGGTARPAAILRALLASPAHARSCWTRRSGTWASAWRTGPPSAPAGAR
jgi:uncharacterized protein YkwD